MPANFEFLKDKPEYKLFSHACVEAERVLETSPAMAAIGCRRALELAIKWVYSADNTMKMPYKDNLQALIHEPTFKFSVTRQTWEKLPYIIKLGNLAAHTEKSISKSDAVLSLSALFEFIQWIDYCYGTNYQERQFNEADIPAEKVVLDEARIREMNCLLEQKESEIEALREKVASMSARLTRNKDKNKEERSFIPVDKRLAASFQKLIWKS